MTKSSWPKGVGQTLNYRLGEKPLHEYLMDHAKERPEETAYVYYGNHLTWKQLYEDTGRLAQFLKLQGVCKGDRIALFMQNCPQYLIGHYAIQMLGATVVPLNPMNQGAELEHLLNEAEIKVAIAGQEVYSSIEKVRSKAESLQFVITTHYADYLSENPALPLPIELLEVKGTVDRTFDFLEILYTNEILSKTEKIDLWEDVSLMAFTSGTTGRPKAAMLTYGNALFKTAATAQSSFITPSDRMLAAVPFCHMAGMVMGVNLPVYSACMSVALTRFEPEAAISAIETYKVNKLYTVASMNVAILNAPGITERDITSLELNPATSFGITIDETLAEAWEELTHGCLLYEASYGLSETHSCDTFMPIDKIKYGTCGIPTFDTDMCIVDLETGEDLEPGKRGEIVLKNPGVFKGYYNKPEATAETLKNGWVYTGDIGMIDEEGYLHFLGRTKEMIQSMGYSIFPEDVEGVLKYHEAILQVAAVGVPDGDRGERVKAFIVLKPEYKGNTSEQQIIDWSRSRMAPYSYPRQVEFRNSLPATSSGKVLRRLLME